jgi:hypothetical protein
MLKREGIEFQICRNPDIKCLVDKRAHRTIRDKLYIYFICKNTYRFIDVLQKFLRGYNASVHSTTGMAHARVTDPDVLAIWTRINKKERKIAIAKPKLRVGQHARISKEKMKFAKGGEKIIPRRCFK